MRIENLQNENRKYAKSIGNFHVLEYVQDASVSPMNAMNEYFMSKMNVRRRQVSVGNFTLSICSTSIFEVLPFPKLMMAEPIM